MVGRILMFMWSFEALSKPCSFAQGSCACEVLVWLLLHWNDRQRRGVLKFGGYKFEDSLPIPGTWSE